MCKPFGKAYPQFRSLSTKAAVALWAVHGDPYGWKVFNAVKDLFHPSLGYYAGLFQDGKTNTSLNVNTNAIILEAVLYYRLKRQPFLQVSQSTSKLASARSADKLPDTE